MHKEKNHGSHSPNNVVSMKTEITTIKTSVATKEISIMPFHIKKVNTKGNTAPEVLLMLKKFSIGDNYKKHSMGHNFFFTLNELQNYYSKMDHNEW